MKNTTEEKPVLSIETSQSLCGACVYFSAEKYYEEISYQKNIHAEKIFESVDTVLKISGMQLKDLDHIAVSNGPGSFTGLRIGMSAVKGLAFGSSLAIVPVPTFEAMALQVLNYLPDNCEFIIANRVNVEEVYYAKFTIKGNSYIFVENLTILKKSVFLESIVPNSLIFGNAIPHDVDIQINEKNIIAPDPKYIAEWSKKFGKNLRITNFDFLEPNYLKNFIVRSKIK